MFSFFISLFFFSFCFLFSFFLFLLIKNHLHSHSNSFISLHLSLSVSLSLSFYRYVYFSFTFALCFWLCICTTLRGLSGHFALLVVPTKWGIKEYKNKIEKKKRTEKKVDKNRICFFQFSFSFFFPFYNEVGCYFNICIFFQIVNMYFLR